MSVSTERLISLFTDLAKIDGISRNEKKVKEFIVSNFNDFVDSIYEDGSADKLNSNTGNLLIKVKGSDPDIPGVILSAHMDTISSTKFLNPIISDNKITSDGKTILGADNRLGIAIIFEVVRSLRENNARFGDIEIVLSVCEEIGLMGIKSFDFSLLKNKIAYVLDAGNAKVGTVINKAPSSLCFDIHILGVAAHAGIAPEKGINAIEMAAKGISKIPQGKIDKNTTLNIGVINGGDATNIVPDKVDVKGEIRSYVDKNVEKRWGRIQKVINHEVAKLSGTVEFDFKQDYKSFYIKPNSKILKIANDAFPSGVLLESSFGASDANIFNQNNIPSVVLGVGVWDPHTKDEYVVIDEIIQATQWIYDIVAQ